MKVLTDRHDTPAHLASDPDFGRASTPGIRDLLRDTGLLVTSLGDDGTVKNAEQFRNDCRKLIQKFSDALTQYGNPEDVKREVLLAQCGLIDETALRHLPESSRAAWALNPFQVERFKVHDAGEFVISRIEARLREATPNADLLEGYAAILGMGFQGRYALDGENRLVELMDALNTRLKTLRPHETRSFISDRAGRQFSDWFHRLSPWVVAAGVCVVAAVIWSTWAVALNAQVTHIPSAKVAQP
ncbi:DotU family type IV/VI secretion system protein [Paraburkholderia sp. CNPSo 3076]|uniref:DotU family type IV/VI secretion system protein n=1 Tax=Paraburkholderia sp. CNPSo 3076 TaxID=2940936 RepID=UPI00225AC98A|nr:DotU family type IV/VI secretion system protein [Paraburkholderia sp. CNPSo 3076]MCX5540632.1 DotU family type IV/VI secretion system protein [Paraburkholderia sp. CNPSo 3076]